MEKNDRHSNPMEKNDRHSYPMEKNDRHIYPMVKNDRKPARGHAAEPATATVGLQRLRK